MPALNMTEEDRELELLHDALLFLMGAVRAFHSADPHTTKTLTEAAAAKIGQTSRSELIAEIRQAVEGLEAGNIFPRADDCPRTGMAWLAIVERVFGSLRILVSEGKLPGPDA